MAAPVDKFYEKYMNLLLLNSKLGENGICQIWTGGTKSSPNYVYGVTNVTFPDGKRGKINVARLSKMLEIKEIYLDKNFDSSHLCHNSLCILPGHIHLEPHEVNNSRQFCVAVHKCTTHKLYGVKYPDCLLHLKFVVCTSVELV